MGNVGGVGKVNRVYERHSFVAKLGFHNVIAARECCREFLDKDVDALLLDPLHIVLRTYAKDTRYKFDQVIQVIFLLKLLEIARVSSEVELSPGSG